MKILWLTIFCISIIKTVDDPLIFSPLSNKCKRVFNSCFEQCSQQLYKNQCPQKKACLKHCDYKLIKSMRPERCYRKCAQIPCRSQADCTQDCFQKTSVGKCIHQCQKATDNCAAECVEKEDNFECLNCCYNQKQLCIEKCCK